MLRNFSAPRSHEKRGSTHASLGPHGQSRKRQRRPAPELRLAVSRPDARQHVPWTSLTLPALLARGAWLLSKTSSATPRLALGACVPGGGIRSMFTGGRHASSGRCDCFEL